MKIRELLAHRYSELPDAGEVWGGVVARIGEWLDQAKAAM